MSTFSLSTLTGLTSGRFDSLFVKNPSSGQYELILPGGGSGGMTSALVQSAIDSSIAAELQSYSSTAQADATVAQTLLAFSDSVQVGTTINSALAPYSTAAQTALTIDAAIALELGDYRKKTQPTLI